MWRTSVTSLSSAACQLARLHCTAPHSYLAGGPARLFTSSADATPVGGYTPITQQLWLERFNVINSTSQEGSSGNTSSKELTYRFSSDHILREQYRNPWGRIRIGRIMEDLDSLAGNIAFSHCRGPPGSPPPLLVTASVDEIVIAPGHAIAVDQDVTLKGEVAWTGSSSLDIIMRLQQTHLPEPSLVALFSFVHLDPATRKAAKVAPFKPQTPQQVKLFAERQAVADERKRQRHAQTEGDRAGMAATPAARAFIQPLLAEYRRLTELPALVGGRSSKSSTATGSTGSTLPGVPLPSTSLQNTFICQPQQRNTHGRIFGGFLMRRAYELAFATAFTFGGARPQFISCDEITFRQPVDVGALLRLRSDVVHTVPEQGLLCIEVEATITRPESVEISTSNTFSFVYQVDHPSQPLRHVLPTNEEEAVRAYKCHTTLLERQQQLTAGQ